MDIDKSLEEGCRRVVSAQGHSSNAVIWSLFLLISITAWARGGSAEITPWLQFVLATLVVVVFLWEVFSSNYSGVFGKVFRDPVLYLGIGLLCLLGVQWMNAGRELYYDEGLKTWLYSEPQYSGLPYAFNAFEARQVWIWFYCGLVIVVVMRSPLVSRNGVYRIWRMIIANACLLGLFGVVQFLSGTDRIFFVKHLPYQRFFASFGYTNHAGAYFVLLLFLSLALMMRRMFRKEPARFDFVSFLFFAAAVLFLFCSNLTLSRFAILMSWTGMTCAAVYAGRKLWRRGGLAARINLIAILICSGFAALYASFSAAGSLLGKELSSFLRLQDDFLGAGRLIMFRSGLSVWTESPVFGVGPWGFRHLVGLHLDEAMHFMLMPGTASLHNDALQYLAEAGVVGVGLMAAILVMLVWHVTPGRVRCWIPGIFVYAGLGAIAMQSLFDLPFRNPAVFYCWLAILAGSSKIINEISSAEKNVAFQTDHDNCALERSAQS